MAPKSRGRCGGKPGALLRAGLEQQSKQGKLCQRSFKRKVQTRPKKTKEGEIVENGNYPAKWTTRNTAETERCTYTQLKGGQTKYLGEGGLFIAIIFQNPSDIGNRKAGQQQPIKWAGKQRANERPMHFQSFKHGKHTGLVFCDIGAYI